jgi:hypothetical protein
MSTYSSIEEIKADDKMNLNLIHFLQNQKLLQSEPLLCNICNLELKLCKENQLKKDNYCYKCTKCGNYKSLRMNSFFF